jgi:hypothetical protein
MPQSRKSATKNHREFAMPLIPDKAAFQNSLASLPLVTYQAGETVIADGSRTGALLILRKGTVVKERHLLDFSESISERFPPAFRF